MISKILKIYSENIAWSKPNQNNNNNNKSTIKTKTAAFACWIKFKLANFLVWVRECMSRWKDRKFKKNKQENNKEKHLKVKTEDMLR